MRERQGKFSSCGGRVWTCGGWEIETESERETEGDKDIERETNNLIRQGDLENIERVDIISPKSQTARAYLLLDKLAPFRLGFRNEAFVFWVWV